MGVAENQQVNGFFPFGPHPLWQSRTGTPSMSDADSEPADLEYATARNFIARREIVTVTHHCRDWIPTLKQFVCGPAIEIARVDELITSFERTPERFRQAPTARRNVRVGNDANLHFSGTRTPDCIG